MKIALSISVTKTQGQAIPMTGPAIQLGQLSEGPLLSPSWLLPKSLNKQNWLNKLKGLNHGLLRGRQSPGCTPPEHLSAWPWETSFLKESGVPMPVTQYISLQP